MGRIRGAAILGTVEYLQATFGDDGVRRVRDALGADTRTVLGRDGASRVITTGWYDCSVLIDLTRVADRVCGKGDLALARAAGRYVAFQDLNRFFLWLLKLSTPSTLFSRAASVWKNYHDCGSYIAESGTDGHAVIRVEDWSSADPVMCKRIEGWMERALELTLGKGQRAVIREEAHLRQDAAVGPHRFCRYVAEWS